MVNATGSSSSSANNNDSKMAEEVPADSSSPTARAALKDVLPDEERVDGAGAAATLNAPEMLKQIPYERKRLEHAEGREVPKRRTLVSASTDNVAGMEIASQSTPGAFSVVSGNISSLSPFPLDDSITTNPVESRTRIPSQSHDIFLEAEAVHPSDIVVAEVPATKWYTRRSCRIGTSLLICSLVIIMVVLLVRPTASVADASSVNPSPSAAPPQQPILTSAPSQGTGVTPEQIACNFIKLPSLRECLATDSISSTTGSTIPSEIGLLTHLVRLDMPGNELTGRIPSSIGNLTKLTWLSFWENALTGSIPPSIGDLTQLQALGFKGNSLTGSIPESFQNLTALDYLDFSSNGLTGSIPSFFGNLVNLTALSFFSNDFGGEIPASLGQLTLLLWFDVSRNELTGQIPSSIGSLSLVSHLGFYSNQLSGSIPSSIANMTQLTYLDFSHNGLVGSIPASFKNLTLMRYLSFADNAMTGSVPYFFDTFKQITGLSFQENAFTGSIPSSLCNLPTWIKVDCGEIECTCCIDDTDAACYQD